MRTLYFDAPTGAGGDMIVGALVDLAGGQAEIRRALAGLGIRDLRTRFRRVQQGSLWPLRFDVKAPAGQPHRGPVAIRRLIRRAEASPQARALAGKVLARLYEAEATIHRIPVEAVHLHEVGAVDSLADVLAAAICLTRLAPDRVVVSPLPTGSGTVATEHGVLPVPAPATVELLRGRPVYGGAVEAEILTPTAAAILTVVADDFGPLPPMRLLRVGMGAGSRTFPGRPNVLRVLEGEAMEPPAAEPEVAVLEANIDDLNPQVYGHLMARLLESGALDAYLTPVQMKKGRPGTLVTAICRPERLGDLAHLLLRETTTLGVRHHRASRWELPRRRLRVRTRFGMVSIKVARLDGEEVQAAPEYEDCRRLAERSGVPLRMVQEEAVRAYRARRGRKK